MEQKYFALAVFGVTVLISAFIISGILPVAAADDADASPPTRFLTAAIIETGDASVTPQILSKTVSIGGIGGKTVTFTGGGVSGGVAWSTWRDRETGTESATGGCPGAGRVQVLGSKDSLLGEFALPLQGSLSFSDVRTIRVVASAPLPAEPSVTAERRSTYSADVIASVIWVEE
jgi:hypothetical protein